MKVQSLENFRTNLRSVLDRNNISQRDFATRAQTSFAYINRVLMGRVSPSIDQCESLAAAAGFPLIDMILPPKEFSRKCLHSIAG